MPSCELKQLTLNLDLDHSDIDNLCSDSGEEVENMDPDPDDMKIPDSTNASSDYEPLAHYLSGY